MRTMLETLVRRLGPGARIAWTRRRRWLPVLVAVVVTAAITATATRVLVGRGDEARLRARNVVGEKLFSKVLDERRRLLVHLPDSYALEPARRYPVLDVLDGGRQDVHTAAAAQVMARIGSAPEMLVVGLPNVNRGSRWRDDTPPYPREEADANGPGHGNRGEADRFLRHLETEVIPLVEAAVPNPAVAHDCRPLARWAVRALHPLRQTSTSSRPDSPTALRFGSLQFACAPSSRAR